MSPRRKAAIAFATALTLLTIGAVATAITIWNLTDSLRWLAHSYQVEVALGDIDSTLTRAARARAIYVDKGDEDYYRQFVQMLNAISPEMGRSRPAMQRKVVVLPQPEGPSSDRCSPRDKVIERPSTAIVPP